MPWWAHWYVMIPTVLALWGFGVAVARARHQTYLRKLASGEIKPKPKPMPCRGHSPIRMDQGTIPCPYCGRR
jgi:hypothetical protein